MTRRLLAVLLTAAALAAGLAACGGKQDVTTTRGGAQHLDLLLDYLPNADHAGIYTAQASGAFREAGLDVAIHTPSDPSSPLKLLATGRADLAISYEPEVLLARDKGLRVVSVAALVQKPLTSIMALGDRHIRTPADLRGKTVGTAGIPYQTAYLDTILDRAGVPRSKVKRVDVGFNLVPAMLSHKVDATLGAFWNYEGVQLARAHRRPSIIRMEQVGVPSYDELVIVAREQTLRDQGATVRRFLQALARGTETLRRDPAAGVDALVKANPDLDRGLQLASVKATLPVFFPESPRAPWGWQEPAQWRAYGDWMLRNRLVRRPIAPTSLTNEFLPGQGI